MRKSLVSCVAVVLILGIAACAKQQPESDLPVADGQASADMIKLSKAYGNEKEFCCQLPSGCVNGPADGGAVCTALGGQPFQKSMCVAGDCVDP